MQPYHVLVFYYQIVVTKFLKRTLALILILTLIIKNSIFVTKKMFLWVTNKQIW